MSSVTKSKDKADETETVSYSWRIIAVPFVPVHSYPWKRSTEKSFSFLQSYDKIFFLPLGRHK